MRIAIDCRLLNKSGIGTYLKNILIVWLSQDLPVKFILIGDSRELDKLLIYSSVEKIINTTIPVFSLKELLFFPTREINQCDAFISPTYNLPLGIKKPIYTVIHDVVFLDVPQLVSLMGKAIRYIYILRACLISRKIFTVSKFSKNRILSYFKFVKDIKVTYNGINYELLENSFFERVIDEEYILYIGNIKKHKGIATLLSAYQDAVNNNLQYKLVIVGSKDNFKTMDAQSLAKLDRLKEQIIYTGYVDTKTLYSILKNASCLIQPSIYEGFGIPPLEGLYFGRKVILSNIEVFKEIYSDYPVNFFEVENINSLTEMLLSLESIPEYDQDQIRNKIIEQYNYKNVADLLMNEILVQ